MSQGSPEERKIVVVADRKGNQVAAVVQKVAEVDRKVVEVGQKVAGVGQKVVVAGVDQRVAEIARRVVVVGQRVAVIGQKAVGTAVQRVAAVVVRKVVAVVGQMAVVAAGQKVVAAAVVVDQKAVEIRMAKILLRIRCQKEIQIHPENQTEGVPHAFDDCQRPKIEKKKKFENEFKSCLNDYSILFKICVK
jgi:hypothetical protein